MIPCEPQIETHRKNKERLDTLRYVWLNLFLLPKTFAEITIY